MNPQLTLWARLLRKVSYSAAGGTADGSELVALVSASGRIIIGYTTVAALQNLGITAGTVTASRALVVDANKDLASLRDVTLRNLIASGTIVVTGLVTPTAGIGAAGGFSISPRNMHTGGNPPSVSTDMTDYTVVVTETIRAELFVPASVSSTGIALFNGSAVAGNVTAYLIDSTGAQIPNVKTASTALSGTDAYQRIPWSGGPYTIVGPATYWIAVQGNNTGGKINTHTIGNFGADKQTGQVYGTLVAAAAPTTFATAVGPVASLY